jgi:hypothetical protein
MNEPLNKELYERAISAGKLLSSILPLEIIHVITDKERGYRLSINAETTISEGEYIIISYRDGKQIQWDMPIKVEG